MCWIRVTHVGQSEKVPLHVLPASGQPLFERNWLQKNKLNWSLFKLQNAVDDPVKEVLQRHEAVFSPELGKLKGIKISNGSAFHSPEIRKKFSKSFLFLFLKFLRHECSLVLADLS